MPSPYDGCPLTWEEKSSREDIGLHLIERLWVIYPTLDKSTAKENGIIATGLEKLYIMLLILNKATLF